MVLSSCLVGRETNYEIEIHNAVIPGTGSGPYRRFLFHGPVGR